MDGRTLIGKKLYKYTNFIVQEKCIAMTLQIEDDERTVEILLDEIKNQWVCLDLMRESFGFTSEKNIRGLDIDDYEPGNPSMVFQYLFNISVVVIPNAKDHNSSSQFHYTVQLNSAKQDDITFLSDYTQRTQQALRDQNINIALICNLEMNKSPIEVAVEEKIVPIEFEDEDEPIPAKRHNTRAATKKAEEQVATENNTTETIPDDEITKTQDKSEVLAHYKSIILTRADLLRANEGEFLNDNVIDFYLYSLQAKFEESVMENKPKVFMFHTTFYPLLKKDMSRVVAKYPKDPSVKLFEYDFVFVPINENAHWMLFVGCFLNDPERRHIICCDPLAHQRQHLFKRVQE